MKNLIAKMNAMKFYKHDELIHNSDDIQENLSQDLSVPAYRKMIDKIHTKHFRTIPRK